MLRYGDPSRKRGDSDEPITLLYPISAFGLLDSMSPWSKIRITCGAECTLHICRDIGGVGGLPDLRDQRRECTQVSRPEVGPPVGHDDERVGRRPVRPGAQYRGHDPVRALVPDSGTVTVGPLIDADELSARKRVKRVRDADSRCRIRSSRCSR